MLKTERNTQATERAVLAAAREAKRDSLAGRTPSLWNHGPHFTATFEHGQWWIECQTCNAQFSVVDSEPGYGQGFDFEEISTGDEEAHR